MGAKGNLRVKRAEKNGALQNCRILFYAILVLYAICHRKKIFPQFLIFLPLPIFFQEAFASTGQWSGRP